MSWLVLTLLAITSRSIYSIATKLLSKNVEVSPITQSVLLTTFAGVLSLLISPIIGGISFSGFSDYWLAASIMVVSQAFGNILFFKGMKSLDAGTAQIGFSSIIIWGAILSVVFLGSSFSLAQVLGILLLMFAIVMVQYKKGSRKLDNGILLIVGSAVLFAIFQVASADLSKTISSGAYLLLAYLGSSILLGILYHKKLVSDWHKLKHQLKHTSWNTLFASGTSLLYFVFSFYAYREAPDSGVVVVLLTAQVILSVILGIIFLKERDNMPKKLAAGIVAVIAGILVKS